MLDGLGFCMMVAPALKDRTILAEMVNAYHGWDLKLEDLVVAAKESLQVEKSFNKAAGFTSAHDRLPEHFYQEDNPASHSRFDFTDEDLAEMDDRGARR